MLRYILLGVIAAGLSLCVTPLVRALASWLGVMDEPRARSVHSTRIARLGGLAVLISFLGTLGSDTLIDALLFDTAYGFQWRWRWLFAGAILVTAAGVADDIWRLSPVTKIGFQIMAGGMVLAGGHGIGVLTNPLSGESVALGWFSWPLTLVWVVCITNAFNLIDGLDGLAAGLALIAAATLWAIGLLNGQLDVTLLAMSLCGALAGFLFYNFHPASIFLGDSGSQLLGYLLSVLSIQAAQTGATGVVILVPVLALGVPIADTLLTVVRRLVSTFQTRRAGSGQHGPQTFFAWTAPLFRPDREHIHHRLLMRGLTHRNVVLILYGIGLGLGLTAFLALDGQGAVAATVKLSS